jgi:hypothetical protein
LVESSGRALRIGMRGLMVSRDVAGAGRGTWAASGVLGAGFRAAWRDRVVGVWDLAAACPPRGALRLAVVRRVGVAGARWALRADIREGR